MENNNNDNDDDIDNDKSVSYILNKSYDSYNYYSYNNDKTTSISQYIINRMNKYSSSWCKCYWYNCWWIYYY